MSGLRRLRTAVGLGLRALAVRAGSRRPFKATISLTNRCDCRCLHCSIWHKRAAREMTPDEIGHMLRPAPWIRWVNLTGGELFLRNDVVEIVRAVHEALPGLAVLDFPTTGQRTEQILADVERVLALDVARLYVTVSVDGPPDLHDELRGRSGAFERAVATYAALRRLSGPSVYLGMTLSEANAHAVSATLHAVRERVPGVNGSDLHLNVLTRSGHYYENLDSGVRPPRDLPRGVIDALRQRDRRLHPLHRIEAVYLRLLSEHLRTGRSPLPCAALRASVFIDAGGDVYPCTVFGRRLGNVRESDLATILDTRGARVARRAVEQHRCPGCWSPCEAHPSIVASLPESLFRR